MSGTQIAQLTSSNSAIHTNYFDPLINQNTNFMALDLRKTGVYTGGYLTAVGNTAVTVSNLTGEIQDSGGSGNQIRIVTSWSSMSVPVSNTSPPLLVVLRWTYTASTTANYPSIYTVQGGSQNSTDLILGTASYSGSTLVVDYGAVYPAYMRSDPSNILDLGLKVEPVSSLPYAIANGVLVRAGRANYGNSTFIIPTQVLTPTGSLLNPNIGTPNYYQNLPLQVTTTGGFYTSNTGATISGSSPVAPAYNNLITIAERTVQYTGGAYYIASIKDVRSFVNANINASLLLPSQVGNAGDFLTTNGTVTSWSTVPYSALSGTVPIWNQSTIGNAATATFASTAPYSGLTGPVPTWNQSTSGNAATATYATTAGYASSAPYGGLTGVVPTWNQNTTGSSAYATYAGYAYYAA